MNTLHHGFGSHVGFKNILSGERRKAQLPEKISRRKRDKIMKRKKIRNNWRNKEFIISEIVDQEDHLACFVCYVSFESWFKHVGRHGSD